MTEGLNWKPLIFLAVIGASWYTLSYKHSAIKRVNRNEALKACTEVCSDNNTLITGALKGKGVLEADTAEFLKDSIDTLCSDDCDRKIP